MPMPPVRKVIIPVAGFGTRFLPVTKAMPKEMLPIIDKPVIQYIVEEAVASGITDVILVTSHTKRPVEDHFDDNPVLESWLKSQGKKRALEDIRDISKLANFIYLRQKGPYGNATPIMNAKHLIGDEPFAVLFGDDVFDAKVPRLRQMLDVYERYGADGRQNRRGRNNEIRDYRSGRQGCTASVRSEGRDGKARAKACAVAARHGWRIRLNAGHLWRD